MDMDDILLGSLYEIRDGDSAHAVVAQEKDEYEGVVYVESYELGMFATSANALDEPNVTSEL